MLRHAEVLEDIVGELRGRGHCPKALNMLAEMDTQDTVIEH